MRRLSHPMALALVLLPFAAGAWNREHVRIFAVLPDGSSGPEGLEVDSAGNVYVTTFGFTAQGPQEGEGQLFVYDAQGNLQRHVSIAGSTSHLLGLRFHPATHALLVIDFGSERVLNVNPRTGAATVFMTVPLAGAGLNDITFDKAGNVYVSDSFHGIVWKTTAAGGVGTIWAQDVLLQTDGVPPFGANGLRFNKHETAMFVANTGDDTVVKIPSVAGVAGKAETFVNSINGADGLLIDGDDNLWVVANQADEVVVVDPGGRAIAKLGDFDGVTSRGVPIHMLFPASIRFHGKDLLATNLSLDLRLFSPTFAAVDSPWCAQVRRYTIVKVRARIPALPGTADDDRDDED